MDIKRKLLAGAVGLLAFGGIGTGIAYAQSSPSPDTKAPAAETQEKPDGAAAKGEAAEPANDPEPGHEDPDGANVDHTPAGEQPEPEAPSAPQG
jgi:hypothetical protein